MSIKKVVADEAAFLDFVHDYWPRLVRVLMRMGANLPDAENAAQEAAIAGWKTVRRFGASTPIVDMAKWLNVVAMRYYLRQIKTESRNTSLDSVREPEDPSAGVEDLAVGTQQVLAALGGLGSQDRTVMVFLMEGYTAEESAASLRDLGFHTATSDQVYRIRKRVKRILSKTLTE